MSVKIKAICKIIKEQAEFWETSNNIESHTHHCDISESVNIDEFTEDEKLLIEFKLVELYMFVKEIRNWK